LKRVKKIGNVELDKNVFISTEFDIDDYIGERTVAIDGSSVVFVQAKGAMSREVRVYSKDSGWQKNTTVDALMSAVNTSSITITYTDDTTDTFYYDHTKIPLKVTPLFEGALWYNIELNLLKG